MPFALIIIGVILADLAWMGPANITGAGTLLKDEFFGGGTNSSSPFYKWLGALIIIGLLGYIPQAKGLATAFLVLIILAIILSNKNFGSFTTLLKDIS